MPSYPRVSALHRHLQTLGGWASWRQGQHKRRQEDGETQVQMPCKTGFMTPPHCADSRELVELGFEPRSAGLRVQALTAILPLPEGLSFSPSKQW